MNTRMTQGMMVYKTLRLAEMDGFHFYDNPPHENYYLVRRETTQDGKRRAALALALKPNVSF